MTTIYPVQAPTTYLAGSGTVVGATSITVTTFVDIYGNTLVIGDFGQKGQGCLEPDTNNEEACTYTGITANANGTFTLTGVKTVLAKTPFTETSGLVRAHAGGTKFVISDTAGFWATKADLNNDVTVLGRWGSATVPSANNDYVNKAYADGLAIAGSPDSSTTVKGIGRVSVAPVSPTIPIFVGDNDGRVPTQAENDALVGTGTPSTANPYVSLSSITGIISPYAGAVAPTGWLLCDGTAVSRATYASLFAVTSTTFGVGDGATTFNLPDLRSRVAVGVGAGTKALSFATTDVNIGTDTITIPTNTSLYTGTSVVFTTTNTLPAGISLATTYYVIRLSATTFQLATSLANASAGTPVLDITSQGTGTHTATVTYVNHTLGEKEGEEGHLLLNTESGIAAHTHAAVGVSTGTNFSTGSATAATSTNAGTGNSTTPVTGSTTANAAAFHNNLQPYIGLTYIIKT